LLLRGSYEAEGPLQRHQKYVWISVFQIRSGEKVGADHLHTVAARFVRTEHAGGIFQRLFHDRQLAADGRQLEFPADDNQNSRSNDN
jgi:hypothetical protein